MVTVNKIAQQLAQSAPIAISMAIDAINKGLECSLTDALDYEVKAFGICCASEDKNEGTSAFLEKPITLQKLLKAVDHGLNKSVERAAAAMVSGKYFQIGGSAGANPWNNAMPTTAGTTPLVTTSAKLSSCTPIGPATPNFRAAQPSNTSSSTAISQIPATHHMPSASKNKRNPSPPPSNSMTSRSQGAHGTPFTAHQPVTTPPNKFPIVRRLGTHARFFMR